MKNKARLDHPRLLVRVGDDATGDYHDYRRDDYAVIVGKMRRRRKHVCAIFQLRYFVASGHASTVFFASCCENLLIRWMTP